MLRNFGIKATRSRYLIRLSQEIKEHLLYGSKIIVNYLHVPFDENPYSALAAWFKTDEGVESLQNYRAKKLLTTCNTNIEGSFIRRLFIIINILKWQ